MAPELVDGHVHADGLSGADLDTLAHFGVRQVVVCAHDGAVDRGAPTTRDWLRQFERLLTVEAARFKAHGVRALFALGVHPAHAPWHGLDELLHRLPAFLSDPAVVAIGSLGLKRGDQRERYVLSRQLELAQELRRPVYVSMPPLAPGRSVKPLANLLRDSGITPERVLVENVTRASLPLLRACRFSLALEPSPGRLTTSEIVAHIQQHGPERIVLTSHAGDGSANLLALPGLAASLVDAGLSAAVVARVARENALRFLGRDDGLRRARTG